MYFSVYFPVSLCVDIFCKYLALYLSLSPGEASVVPATKSSPLAHQSDPTRPHSPPYLEFNNIWSLQITTKCLWVIPFQGFSSYDLCVYDLPILHIAEHSLKLRTISRLASRTYHLVSVKSHSVECKNGHKLPPGQWYAPPAVINVAKM